MQLLSCLELGDSQMIVGAGTVLDAETARIAIMKGARYIVSPHFDGEIATCVIVMPFLIYQDVVL